jgi:DNA-binding transcriptional MocR family regulator
MAAGSQLIPTIDLTAALPPTPAQLGEGIRQALADLSMAPDLGKLMRCNRIGGSVLDREAGAAWVARRLGPTFDPARLVVTNGTQSSVLLLLNSLVGRGGTIAAEALTYVVLKKIATRLGIQVAGVELDAQGLIPESFDEVCRRCKPRALYCNPTIHNPTAAVMSEARRLDIAAIATRHGVAIIEDEVLGAMHPEAPKPIAAIAPDISWYIMSVSKCFAMGLRLAYVVAPDADAAQQLTEPASRLSWWIPNSLSAEIIGRWIRNGTAVHIADAVRAEAEARHAIAADVLGGARFVTIPGALHLWLNLPGPWTRQDFVAIAQRRGVLVRPADLFAVDARPVPESVRVSLTGPETREELRDGLAVIATLLGQHAPASSDSPVGRVSQAAPASIAQSTPIGR